MSSDSALILKDIKYLNCRPDLIVRATKNQYRVHRIVFLCLSPYFQSVFHYRSQSLDGYYELDLKDVSDETLVLIINFAYTGRIDIDEDNVEELLIIADKYSIISIVKLCEQFLWKSLDSNNCIEIYLLSHYYNCDHLKSEVHKFIIENDILDQSDGLSSDDKFTVDMVLKEWQKRNKQ